MHFGNRAFRIFDFLVQDVGCAAIYVDCKVSCEAVEEIIDFVLTDWIQRKFDFLDRTVATKDLAQMAFVDILCELLNYNLCPISNVFNVRLERRTSPAA
jgi:hypothetical protein